VDKFGRTSLAWASLGLESHRMDTMADTPNDDGSLWRLEKHLGGPFLALHHTNDLPLESRVPHLGGDLMHELGFLVVVMLLVDTWHLWMERSTLKIIALEEKAFGGPNVISKPNVLPLMPNRFPRRVTSSLF
jgi:hypothetical protein